MIKALLGRGMRGAYALRYLNPAFALRFFMAPTCGLALCSVSHERLILRISVLARLSSSGSFSPTAP